MIQYLSVIVLFFTDMVTMKEKLVHLVLPTPNNIEDSHSVMDLSTWEDLMIDYGVPFGGYCAGMMYTLYLQMSFANIGLFMLKYAPMLIYLYKLVKDVFIASRKKIKLKQSELEDIVQQIADANTKLVDRDASLDTFACSVRLAAERLRRVRARVRALIATDDSLKHALDGAGGGADDDAEHVAGEDRELLDDLLKEFQCVQPYRQTNKECGEGEPSDATPDESVYSAARGDVNDCQVKIVKVTNVYKVAYLRHFIKQKRQRRATKQALLKSKVESVKSLFEDWQKALNMVVNTKLSMYNMTTTAQLDDASQEAMGDFSKPNLCSDSDSELRPNEVYLDELWTASAYKNSNYTAYDYEDGPDSARECDVRACDSRARAPPPPSSPRYPCECTRASNTGTLCALAEETHSQIAMAEITDKEDDD